MSDHWSELPDMTQWGPWHLDKAVFVLWTDAGGYRYEIDLEGCTGSARVLDWIIQIAEKTWGATLAEHQVIVSGLVAAFDDVLYPQSTLCSGGQDKRLSGDEIKRLVRSYHG